ncbi:MAG: hypothetical protein N3F09_04070 [Bacteroidia bacterium]|nr:hypothetical protein [Bacteroidia bacterium]
MSEKVLFEEKQYLGSNHFSLILRLTLATFCFVAYYWSQNPKPIHFSFFSIGSYPLGKPEQTGQIFFLAGLLVMIISISLMFVLHSHIRVYENYIMLDGFWGTRRVMLDLSGVVKIRKSRYKHFLLRRATYNLHRKSVIRFYTYGKGFVELTYENGITYKIGTQKPSELFHLLKEQIAKVKNLK